MSLPARVEYFRDMNESKLTPDQKSREIVRYILGQQGTPLQSLDAKVTKEVMTTLLEVEPEEHNLAQIFANKYNLFRGDAPALRRLLIESILYVIDQLSEEELESLRLRMLAAQEREVQKRFERFMPTHRNLSVNEICDTKAPWWQPDFKLQGRELGQPFSVLLQHWCDTVQSRACLYRDLASFYEPDGLGYKDTHKKFQRKRKRMMQENEKKKQQKI